jgi:phosphohistidine phosphatase
MTIRLVIVRHAIAVDKEKPGYVDRLRPLTKKGRREFAEVLAGFSRLKSAKPGLILSSPYVRAWQTAEMLGEAIGSSVQYCEALEPGVPLRKVTQEIRRAAETNKLIYAVGHNPDISIFAARCIGARPDSLPFKKGGMASLVFEDPPTLGLGTLEWLMQPEESRRA